MSKEFHKWYYNFKSNDKNDNVVGEEMAESGWDACKKEIIKLVKKHISTCPSGVYEIRDTIIKNPDDLLKEIEEL